MNQARADFNGAFYANAALKNLLQRTATRKDVEQLLEDEAFQVVENGRRWLHPQLVRWMVTTPKAQFHSLISPQTLYLREEIVNDATWSIRGIELRPFKSRKN
jgi:hypothetical protein